MYRVNNTSSVVRAVNQFSDCPLCDDAKAPLVLIGTCPKSRKPTGIFELKINPFPFLTLSQGLPRSGTPPQLPRKQRGLPQKRDIRNVKKIVAVSSAKGGVGKSTIAGIQLMLPRNSRIDPR